MNIRSMTSCAAIALMASAPAALADPGFYYGVGLGFSSMESFDGAASTSEADTFVLGLTLGYRWENMAMFYGLELDADLSGGADFEEVLSGATCAVGAIGPYWCNHDSTVRFRGLVGQTMASGTELFGSLGVVSVHGDSAVAPAATASIHSTGYTIGIGLQQDFTGMTGRLELIYDQADNSNNPGGFDPDYKAVTLKSTLLF